MISGEDRPEHVPEAQGVCGQPHWPGGKLNNNYDDFSVFLWWLLYNDIICINCRWRKSEERQRQGVLTTYFVFRILYFYVYLYLFSRTQIKFVFTSMCISSKHQSFWWENNIYFIDFLNVFQPDITSEFHTWVSFLCLEEEGVVMIIS